MNTQGFVLVYTHTHKHARMCKQQCANICRHKWVCVCMFLCLNMCVWVCAYGGVCYCWRLACYALTEKTATAAWNESIICKCNVYAMLAHSLRTLSTVRLLAVECVVIGVVLVMRALGIVGENLSLRRDVGDVINVYECVYIYVCMCVLESPCVLRWINDFKGWRLTCTDRMTWMTDRCVTQSNSQ